MIAAELKSDANAVLSWIDEGNPNSDWGSISNSDKSSGLNPETTKPEAGIYGVLMQHQVTGDWRHRELVAELHRWAMIFNAEFSLGVTDVALRVDWLKARTLGHFRSGHNGFGLKGEIAINERHLHRREPWQILGTVLHELLHAWQEEHGKPGRPPYHNVEFRRKAVEFGLVIDEDGVTAYFPESRFMTLLHSHGVRMPDFAAPTTVRLEGTSKLKKWSCLCPKPVNVRVAIEDFEAICLKCGSQFERAG